MTTVRADEVLSTEFTRSEAGAFLVIRAMYNTTIMVRLTPAQVQELARQATRANHRHHHMTGDRMLA